VDFLLELFGAVFVEAVATAAREAFLGGDWAPKCETETLFGVWWNDRDSA
jgi:hypothetical protein